MCKSLTIHKMKVSTLPASGIFPLTPFSPSSVLSLHQKLSRVSRSCPQAYTPQSTSLLWFPLSPSQLVLLPSFALLHLERHHYHTSSAFNLSFLSLPIIRFMSAPLLWTRTTFADSLRAQHPLSSASISAASMNDGGNGCRGKDGGKRRIHTWMGEWMGEWSDKMKQGGYRKERSKEMQER